MKKKHTQWLSLATVALAGALVAGTAATYWPEVKEPVPVEIRLDVGTTRGEIVLGFLKDVHLDQHGVYQYCRDYPRECDDSIPAYAGDEWRQQVLDVNTYVDTVMHWPADMDAYTDVHEREWQLHPDGFGIGVCVEHAIAKRHILMEAGIPPGALALATVNDAGDPRGANHMVLLVRFRDGVYVLNNQDRNVWPITASGFGQYVWFYQQDWGFPRHWVSVGTGSNMRQVRAGAFNQVVRDDG